MFDALIFLVSMMALIGMALFPKEREIITRLGVAILLLLYEAEYVIKIVKDIIREMRADKKCGE
jgi:hypothetical protein